MKRKKLGARIIAVALLSMLMILLTGCNGDNKKASAISTSSAIAESPETLVPLSVAGNTEHVEGKVYTFDKVMLTNSLQTEKLQAPATHKHTGLLASLALN